MGDFIILGVIAIIIVAAIAKVIIEKKKGSKCIGCPHSGGGCPHAPKKTND